MTTTLYRVQGTHRDTGERSVEYVKAQTADEASLACLNAMDVQDVVRYESPEPVAPVAPDPAPVNQVNVNVGATGHGCTFCGGRMMKQTRGVGQLIAGLIVFLFSVALILTGVGAILGIPLLIYCLVKSKTYQAMQCTSCGYSVKCA